MSQHLHLMRTLKRGSVRLVPPDHEGYRRWASAMRRRKQALRGRGFGPSAADRLPYVLEAAVRHWLGGRLALLDERIVSYEVDKGSHYEPAYRELDIVCGQQRTPELIIEVKSGRSRSVLADARAQVTASAAVMQTTWPGLRTAVLLLRGEDAPPLEPSPLVDYLLQPEALHASRSSDRLPCLIADARTMFEHALEHGLCNDPELYDQAAATRSAAASRVEAMLTEAAQPGELFPMASALLRWQRTA